MQRIFSIQKVEVMHIVKDLNRLVIIKPPDVPTWGLMVDNLALLKVSAPFLMVRGWNYFLLFIITFTFPAIITGMSISVFHACKSIPTTFSHIKNPIGICQEPNIYLEFLIFYHKLFESSPYSITSYPTIAKLTIFYVNYVYTFYI